MNTSKIIARLSCPSHLVACSVFVRLKLFLLQGSKFYITLATIFAFLGGLFEGMLEILGGLHRVSMEACPQWFKFYLVKDGFGR